MKRLLLFSSEFPPGPGGIGTHAYQLAIHMQQAGWDVHVLTLQDYVSPEEAMAFNQTQQFPITSITRRDAVIRNALRRWSLLQSTLKNWRPDLLLVTGDWQTWLAAVIQAISPFSNLPWCAVWHGDIPPQRIARWVTCWAFSQPDLIITVSQYSLKQMLDVGIRPRRSLVITNGADEQHYCPDLSAGWNVRNQLGLVDVPLLLTVGHLTQRKGQDIIIRALPDVLKTIPDVHYVMAGLPTLQKPLEELADELGVRAHVHFLGKTEPDLLKALYNACDVFVLTSRHSTNGQFEGYGIVAVEAALCAKPAIVAGNSGLAEAVQDGQTGLVVPEDDPEATAQAILTLLQDPELRKCLGERARQRALAEQTWAFCMGWYDKALRQLVQELASEQV